MGMDLSGRPYYDRSADSINKNYTRLAFRPDVPLQQSELNELQSMVEHFLRTSGDAIFSDGDIVTGLDFDLTNNLDGTINVNVHTGTVYVDGKVRQYDGGTVVLSGTGDETINVIVDSDIVTHATDPSLLDPTIGAPSESSEGADRVRDIVRLVANNDELPVIYNFEDGKLLATRDVPGVDKIMDVLAERTYDESGSYRVDGMELYIDQSQETEEAVSLMVSAGKAYVRGYKVEKPSASRISIPKSLDTREVIDESQMYYDSVSGSTYQKVLLNNRPVHQIRSVTGNTARLRATVTRSATSRIDSLPDAGITGITAFYVGGVVTTYTAGTDYQLVNGNQIQWIVGGRAPSSGTTYQVSYRYIKTFVSGTDYSLKEVTAEANSQGMPAYYIDFSDKTGDKPVDGYAISITYTYYLARKDAVRLDRTGKYTIISGQPSTIDSVLAPVVTDPLTLPIGTVTVFPNSTTASVNSETVTNIPFEKLQKVVARVQTLEYNVATMAMGLEAQQGHDPMLLRGIFSDGFNTLEKLDEGLEGILENGAPLRYVAYSFDDAEITLPFREEQQNDMTYVPESPLSGFESMSWGRIVTSPYKRTTLINQSIATGIMNVNPYMVFTDVEGAMKLNPANDSWIEKETITVNNVTTKTYRVNRWWLHNGVTRDADSEFIKNNKDIQWDKGSTVTNNLANASGGSTRTGIITTNGGTNTIEESVQFMRQRTVKITAEGLIPYSDNLFLTFNGIKTSLTPTGSTSVGTQAGTVKANATGKVTASFTVPSGQRCGTVDVELKNTPSSGRSSSASAIYTAQGIKRTTENIINTVRVTAKLYDPLAQSFQVPDDRIIAGVGLYFQSKDATVPVTVQIRGMSDGGMPNRTIYAEKVLQPAEVAVSTKGTTVTNVYFDDPLLAKAGDTYAIVVVTDSADYNMFIATMGQTRVDDATKKLTTQAYTKGVLFSSSNAQTWTPHQESDMKFKVYATEFKEGLSTVQFDSIKDISVDKLLVTASYLTPANTGCHWQIRLVLESEPSDVTIASKLWNPVGNFTDIDPTAMVREAQIQATFESNKYMSPMFALDDFSLMSFLTELKASYVGKTVDMTGAEFDTMHITYQSYEPVGLATTSVTPKIHVGEMSSGQFKWRTATDFSNPSSSSEHGSWTMTKSEPDLDGFVTVNIVARSNQLFSKFKFRLDLATNNPVARPRVSALRCTMTNEGNA